MVEFIIATYGGLCYLLFVRFKVIAVNTYSVMTAILGGVLILAVLWGMLAICHPASSDARLYEPVIPIVAEVRGRVVEIPIEENQPIDAGDVLFRIDPRSYQFEVDRLQALLASKNLKVAQLASDLAAAEAVARGAKANVLAKESEYERQLRLKAESATAVIRQIEERLGFARKQLARAELLKESTAISEKEYERHQTDVNARAAELAEAKSNKSRIEEELAVGNASVLAAREESNRAEAVADRIRAELEAESDGVNPEVRETMALLDDARLNLERCVVRAPSSGRVPQMTLRPGQMATPLPLNPMMAFVPDRRPYLVASFPQNVLHSIEPEQDAEIVFAARPGRVFSTRVKYVMPIIREGELDASGRLLIGTSELEHGNIPIVFEFNEQIRDEDLPTGAVGTIAIYTDRMHTLRLVRKIVLRIRSWENYLFFLPFPNH